METNKTAYDRPNMTSGHHGTLLDGVVTCSWCQAKTPTAQAPPLMIICSGCRCCVRVEAEATEEVGGGIDMEDERCNLCGLDFERCTCSVGFHPPGASW